MKATWPPPPHRVDSASLKALDGPQCEVLFELFEGEFGRVNLGRLLTGNDAGRLVTLRTLRHTPSTELVAAVELARRIAHPQLAKTLGMLRADGAWCVAAEYIPGITLFELEQTLLRRGGTLSIPAAVRLTLDMLHAAAAAKQLLADTANLHATRCLYRESVWLADFGEVFLSEVLVSATRAPPGPIVDADADPDVGEAGHRLVQLTCGSLKADQLRELELPHTLRDVIAPAIGVDGARRYRFVQEFADALLTLQPSLVASDEELNHEVRRLMGTVIDTRRQKLAMTERVSSQENSAQDETRFFRATVTAAQRDTERPSAQAPPKVGPPGERSSNARMAAASEQRPSEPPDEATTIFRSPSLESESSAEVTLDDAAPRAKQAPRLAPRTEQVEARAALESTPPQFRDRIITPGRFVVALLLLLAGTVFFATSPPPAPDSTAQSGWQRLLARAKQSLR